VKCIPHSKKGSWLAPGNVMIIVIPDLRNQNAVNPLQPKVDLNTLTQITSWVQDRAWAQNGNGTPACITVKNPSYKSVRVDFKVSFLEGYDFNFYKAQLDQQIIQFLSPWAYTSDVDISFDSTIYKSVILDFIQDIGYVDFVTDFKMVTFGDDKVLSGDLDEAVPGAPDTILVSAKKHTIGLAT
jgi:hypothetical protein